MQIDEETVKQAMNACVWVTCSPHEWAWTHEQQIAMARYCVYAASELSAWRWLTEMACTVQENAIISDKQWTVFDVEGDILGRGATPTDAIRDARSKCDT